MARLSYIERLQINIARELSDEYRGITGMPRRETNAMGLNFYPRLAGAKVSRRLKGTPDDSAVKLPAEDTAQSNSK